MAGLATGFLLAAHLVNQDLGPPTVGHHRQFHRGVLDVGLTQRDALGILDEQHGVQGDGAVHRRVHPVEVEVAIGLEPHLLATGVDDRVHGAVRRRDRGGRSRGRLG
jgi:hypothetical protein